MDTKELKRRLLSKSHADRSGCRLWSLKPSRAGYGIMWWKDRTQTAHRLSWQAEYGPIPTGLWVLHKCDVRACIEPTHLFLGTPKDNMQDKIRKGRGFIPDPTTHVRGTEHPFAILNERRVRLIRASAESAAAAARRYGVSKSAIKAVRSRKTWSHVD